MIPKAYSPFSKPYNRAWQCSVLYNYGVFVVAPCQSLPAAVTVRLIFPVHGQPAFWAYRVTVSKLISSDYTNLAHLHGNPVAVGPSSFTHSGISP